MSTVVSNTCLSCTRNVAKGVGVLVGVAGFIYGIVWAWQALFIPFYEHFLRTPVDTYAVLLSRAGGWAGAYACAALTFGLIWTVCVAVKLKDKGESACRYFFTGAVVLAGAVEITSFIWGCGLRSSSTMAIFPALVFGVTAVVISATLMDM